jgi:hypothetical protein
MSQDADADLERVPDALADHAAGLIPDTIRALPPENMREAMVFHRWLEGRLAELRATPLSFVDAVLPEPLTRRVQGGA